VQLGPLRRLVLVVVASVLAIPVTFLTPPPVADALTVDDMTNTGTYDVHGDFILVGNGVLTTSGTNAYGYTAANLFSGSTAQNSANDLYKMVNYDGDSNSSTFNSSSATVTIPTGATVVAAKVFWSGNTGGAKGYTGVTCTADSQRPATLPASPATSSPSTQPVSVTVNGTTTSYAPSNYTTDTGLAAVANLQSYYYAANADITSQFAGLTGDGTAKTITVGNVWAPQGFGCYGGWSMELVYDFGSYDTSQPSASQRRIVYMFEGYERKFSGDPETVMTLTGLRPQGSGAKMGIVAFEGDASISQDTVSYSDTTSGKTAIANPVTKSTTNYFVGIANGAVPYASYSGTFYNASVNAQTSDLPNLVAGDSTLNLYVGTSGDSFLMTNTVVSVPVADIKLTKTASNGEQDAAYAPGSTPSFRLTIYNSGSVAITKVSITDQMVAGCAKTEAEMRTIILGVYPNDNGFIPPGGSVQYTCTAPATSTGYTNIATVYGQTGTGIPVSSSNDSKVLIGQWQVTKAPTQPDVPIGTIPTWEFTIKNTGTADIYNLQVNDPNAPACNKTIPLVTAGTTYTYQCQGPAAITTRTTNGFTATGSAQATSTSTIKVPLTASVDPTSSSAPAVDVSGVTVTKTASKAVVAVGEAVTFTFTVKNTGTATLDTVALTDPEFPSCNQANVGPIAGGATKTVTCTVTPFTSASQTAVTNTVKAVGTPASGQTVQDTASVAVNDKALKLAKSATTTDVNGNGVLDAGDRATYSFTVTNTGSTTLTGVKVSDPKLSGTAITCTPTTLAPGAQATCTAAAPYTLTQADVDAGSLVNTATATGTAPDGTTTTGTASVALTPVQQPAITMTKTASPTTVTAVGQVVTYTFAITNSGNTSLTGVTPTDPLTGLSALSCKNSAGTAVTIPASLAPKATLTCTATRTATQDDLNAGKVVNTASITATSPKGTAVTNTATATVTATQSPKLQITKTADATTFGAVGQSIKYTFTTTNTGNVTLSGVQMSDPNTRLANRVCTPTQPAVLAPGESVTCTATLTVTQADLDGGAILNTASVTANPPGGPAITGSASWVVSPTAGPAISLDKAVSLTSITAAGQVVTYTLTATNSGNTTLNSVRVADALPGLVMGTCSPTQGSSLAPGAKMTCTATYTSTQADVDRGSIVNTATATATDSHGTDVNASQSKTVTAAAAPAVQLTKTASPSQVSTVGTDVTYTFVVRNSGNVTLNQIALTDPLSGLGAISCTPTALGGSLAPGATTTCTAVRKSTQDDIDAGQVTNTATVNGTAPDGTKVSATSSAKVTATQSPNYTIQKQASPLQVTKAGEVVIYSITVANTGNTSLANLRVSDPRLASMTCSPTAAGGSLAPGASTTCTGTYTATQTDVNSGTINNTATAVLTPPTGSDIQKIASAVVTASAQPSFSLTKAVTPTTYTDVGDTLTYTITGRNTGNVTMTNVQVSDPMFPSTSPLACTPALGSSLAPNDTITCTGTHQLTQAELDAGTIPNTATVRGTSPSGTSVQTTASTTATATQSPAYTLTKTANPASISTSGRAITYTVLFTNTGNVSLSAVTLTDPKLNNGGALSCTPAAGSKIAPGGTTSCTGTYTSTQADVDSGAITNTAQATATPPTGAAITKTASTVVTIAQTATLTLAKSASPNRVNAVGQVVTYSFLVTNTGNTTVHAIALTDPMAGLSAISCPTTTLAPGATTTCTATRTTTQADLNQASAQVQNTATVNGLDPQNKAITPATSTATVAITQTPKLAITKTASPTTINAVGTPVTYTITVQNTGNVDATNVAPVDNLIASLSCTPFSGSTLAPGASMTCTGTRATTQADLDAGKVVNTATVTATAPNGSAITPPTAQATVTATQSPSVTLDKTASRTSVQAVGDTITYSYLVTNTGNVTIGSLKVNDPHGGLTPVNCGQTTSLAPGASVTCTASYSTTLTDLNAGAVTDTATVTAERPGGNTADPADDLSATDSVVVTAVQTPGLSLTKTASQTTYQTVGRVITYSFSAQNTGNVTLSNVQVTDKMAGLSALTCTPALGSSLAPQATMNCTGTRTTTQADIDAGSLTNTATVSGTTPGGAQVTKDATRTITAVANTSMTFTKAASPTTVTAAGQTITYTFTATNNGNVTMSSLVVADPMPGVSAPTCAATSLAPGASTTCTASYAVTQADVDRGTISNTASMTAKDPTGATLTRTSGTLVTATQTPKVAIDKTADRSSFDAVGQVVNYTFRVSNVGNTSLQDVVVSDPLVGLSAISCPASTLAVGASMDCTASYTIKQSDIDAGRVQNTASVRGTSPTGVAAPGVTDTNTVTAVQSPSRTFVKSASPATVSRVGEVVTYTFEVHNTGNTTINNVLVSDPMYAVGMSTQSCNVYAPDGVTVARACAGAISLAPGEWKRRVATYTVKQSDLDAGSIPNTASLGSTGPGGAALPTLTSSFVVGVDQQPEMTLQKTSDTSTYSTVGQTITYQFLMTNTGNVSLANVQLTDPLPGPSALSCNPAAGTTIAPRGTMRCTATYKVTQADIDARSIKNTATVAAVAPSGETLTRTADREVTATLTPSVALAKSVAPNPATSAGQTITYSFLVTNTGNTTLHDLAVTDPLPGLSAVSCPVTELAPTRTTTCTATMTLTQAQVDAGQQPNTATVSGTDPAGTKVTRTSSATLRISQAPKLTLDKTASPSSVGTAGDTVQFSFVVTNDGNTTINDIQLVDPLVQAGPLSCPETSLAPGASMTCTTQWTVTQQQVDAGGFTNEATATGTTTSGAPVTPAVDTAVVDVPVNADWTFTKTPSTDQVPRIGQNVTWTLTMTNTGNVTLNNVLVADAPAGAPTLTGCVLVAVDGTRTTVSGPSSVAPGEQRVCTVTHTFTQADFEVADPNEATAGIDWPNTATVTADRPDTTPMDPLSATAVVYLQPSPDFAVTKTANVQSYSRAGQVITYNITARNTGNVALNNLTVVDQKLANVTLSCSPAAGSTLQPGGVMSCQGQYTVTQADVDAGAINNVAYGRGTDNQGVVHDSTAPGQLTIYWEGSTGLDLSKTARPAAVTKAGEVVTYTFTVNNPGDTTLTNLQVTDPMPGLSAISCPDSVPAHDLVECTATYTVTQADIDNEGFTNTASVRADAAGTTLTDTASTDVVATHQPGITLAKSATVTNGNPGTNDGKVDDVTGADADRIEYNFVVTNTGNVALHQLVVDDPRLPAGSLQCPTITALAPGESTTCTASYQPTQTDLNQAAITNAATVSALDLDNEPISSTVARTSTPTVHTPALEFTKTASTATMARAGEVVTYTFTATNTGNVSLFNVNFTDPLRGLSALQCGNQTGPVTLDPGATKTCTATRTITQADVDAGTLPNTATASSTLQDGTAGPRPTSNWVLSATQTPALEVTKQVAQPTYSRVNDVLDYTITVTNTGNVSLQGVTPTDDLAGLGTIDCIPAAGLTLAPGAVMSCSAQYTVTQADLDNGTVTNAANATGAFGATTVTDPDGSGEVVSTAELQAGIDLVKSSDTVAIHDAGQVVTYTFTVTNTGTGTLKDVVVTDPMPNLSQLACGTWDRTLAPGANHSCTATYTVTQADIDAARPLDRVGVANVATASGLDAAGNRPSDEDDVMIQVQHRPVIDLTKSATPATVSAVGETVSYTFRLTNTGNVGLTDIVLTDPIVQGLSCPSTTLAQGASMDCTATLTVEQHHLDQGSIPNTATVHANDIDRSISTSDQDSFTVDVTQSPSMTLDKTVSPTTVTEAGQVLTYTFVATNTGNVSLANVIIDDPIEGLSPMDCSALTGAVTLLPGQVKTCTATRTVTQADIDAGAITNKATLTAIPPTGTLAPVSDDALASVTQRSQLDVVKTVDSDVYSQVGQVLTYGITVTNSGNTSVQGVQLTETIPVDSTECTPVLGSTLASSQSMACTVRHTITQADLDRGHLDNVASASGTSATGAVTGTSNQVSSTAQLSGSLNVSKSGSPAIVTSADQTITWTFIVENTGNATRNDITLTDDFPGLGEISCDQQAPYRLAPGAELTCLATAPVTQAMIDAADETRDTGIENQVQVTGVDVNQTVSQASTTAQVAVQHQPAIGLTKTVSPSTFSAVGTLVTYTFTITNEGNVSLKGLTLTDPLPRLSAITCEQDLATLVLAPGEQVVCQATRTIGQTGLDNGQIVNTATVAGTDLDGNITVQQQASATLKAVQNPSMTLEKVSDVTSVNAVGDLVTYTMTMTNTGNVTLTNVVISDPVPNQGRQSCTVTAVDGTQRDGIGPVSVAPGETKSCVFTHAATQADLDAGAITNTAKAEASAPGGTLTAANSNPVVVTAQQAPAIELVKAVSPTRVAAAGDTVTYTFTLRNVGTVTLDQMVLSDQMQGLTNFRCDVPTSSDMSQPIDFALAPGSEIHCFADKQVSADEMNQPTLVNRATVTAAAPGGDQVTSTSSATLVPVHQPKLSLDKSHDLTRVVRAGEKFTFSFLVSNVGNVAIDQVVVDDPTLDAPATCQQTSLAVGEATTCTGTYTVTQADIDRGRITNSATATGVDPIGGDPVVPGEDTDEVPVAQQPALAVTKSSLETAPVALGNTARFGIVVRNTGNVTMSNVTADDQSSNLRQITCDPAQPATLAPGLAMTCTAEVTVTQDDVDQGFVHNYVYAHGTDPNGSPLPQAPYAEADAPTVEGTFKATFTKTADRTTVSSVGERTAYTFTVENTGSLSLYSPEVLDEHPNLSAIDCHRDPSEPLRPGQTMTCDAYYIVTQADLDAGTIDNTADLSGWVPPDFGSVHLTDQVSVRAVQQPQLSVTKTADRTTVNAAGDVVNYTFTVRNSGNVTTSFVTVQDDLPGLGALTCVNGFGTDTSLPASLDPGESLVCTAAYSTTQTDMDSGSVVNTATATGRTPLGAVVTSPADGAVVGANQNTELAMTKVADKQLVQTVGEQVNYTIAVTNRGNVSLAGATITDPLPLQNYTCSPAAGSTLAPGATMTCTGTYSTTHADLENGGIRNTASFTGTDPTGASQTSEAGAVVAALYNPKMEFTKSVSAPENWVAGDTITYTFHVRNVGNMNAYYVWAKDSMADLSSTTCVVDGTNIVVTQNIDRAFPPGVAVTCVATYVAKQSDVDGGFITNTATLTAQEATGQPFPTEAATAITRTEHPASLSLVKGADATELTHVGQLVNYSFTITNTGQVTVSGGQISDPLPGLGTITCDAYGLAPGGVANCTAPYTVTQADLDRGHLDNTATMSARDPHATVVGPLSDSLRLDAVTRPELSLAKESRTSQVTRAGEVVQFTVTATNTGNVTASDVQIDDPGTTLVGCDRPTPATLAPGRTLTCTVDYTVTQSDIDRGQLTNVASVTGTDPQGVAIAEKTASKTVLAQRTPSVALTKTADRTSFDTLGQTITYTLTATNNGNTTIHDAVITDPMPGLSALDCTPAQPAVLQPDQKLVCRATHQVTQADLDTGTIANTASVHGENLGGNPDDPADDVSADAATSVGGVSRPGLSLVKSADRTSVSNLSDVITYTFTVRNTGNTTLHDVLVADPKTGQGMSPINCPATQLAPGASMKCSATFTPAQIDLDRGTIPNTATVSGIDPFNTTTRAEGSTTVGVEQRPDYMVTKTADHLLVTTAGERVLYTFIGTNIGNVSLHVVELDDPLPGLGTMDCYPRLPVDLPPSESVICRAWYTTTQADLDRGTVKNTVTITGNDPQGNPLPPKTADEVLETVASESITVSKVADRLTVDAAGQVVEYTFVATNHGNQTVSDVVLHDPMQGLSPITCDLPDGTTATMPEQKLSLVPGQSVTCHANYTVTQADIDGTSANRQLLDGDGTPVHRAGETAPVQQQTPSVFNTVTVTATQAGRVVAPASATAMVPVVHDPSFTVTKKASVDSVVRAGDPVRYTLVVKNTGNTSLQQIVLSDPMDGLGEITCDQPLDQAVLTPGQELTCGADYVVNQADIDSGAIDNQVGARASAPALVPGAEPVQLPVQHATAHVDAVRKPAVSLSKTADATSPVSSGDTVTYTFTMTNTGNTTATVTSLADPLPGLSAITCEQSLPVTLAPGATNTCTAQVVVSTASADAGSLPNQASLTATGPSGTIPVAPSSVVLEVAQNPSFTVEKTASVEQVAKAGDPVRYTVTVTNTGDVTLTGITLDDPLPGLGAFTCDQPLATAHLAPGAKLTCTAGHLATQAEVDAGGWTNEVTARATFGRVLEPQTASVRVDAPAAPSVQFTKTSDAVGKVAPGTHVTYTMQVRNTGNVTATVTQLSDPMPGLSVPSCDMTLPARVAPGHVLTCTAVRTIQVADVDAGELTNTASVTLLDPSGGVVEVPDAHASVEVRPNPAVEFTKSAALADANGDGFGQVGEKVTYTLTVTNTGDRTLEGLRIDDPMLPSLACTPALERPLAPGAKLVCTGSHVITEAEAVTGELVNTAVLYSPLLPQTDASATVRTKEAQPVAPTPTSKPAPRPVKHTLPNTGADVSPWMLGLGLLMSMAGIMLIVRRKKENS